jgi:predicted metal-dependent HD superfamily phosphohydrolase
MDMEMRDDWLSLLKSVGVPPAQAGQLLEELTACYTEPHRAYHTLDHVRDVLSWVQFLRPWAADPTGVQLAGWFHDAVYNPRAKDNEEQSARMAKTRLTALRLPSQTTQGVCRLILLTRHHLTTMDDRDGEVLLDADLAILGAPAEEYENYARAIRLEYAWVPEPNYRVGRCQVLHSFLERGRIYVTQPMFEHREQQARINLQNEVATLV